MIKRPLNSKFSDKVRERVKITTIRDNPWPVGTPIMLYNWSGAPYRSKHADVAAVKVIKTMPIRITRTTIDLMTYTPNVVEGTPLWMCEGFESMTDMDDWFSSKMKIGQTTTKALMRFKLWEGGGA